jgi:hypothetical protein
MYSFNLGLKAKLEAERDKIVAELAEEQKLLAADLAGVGEARARLGADAYAGGDVEALAAGISTQEKRIEVRRAKIQHAEGELRKANVAILQQEEDDLNRVLDKLIDRRMKAGKNLQATYEVSTAAFKDFEANTDDIRELFVNNGRRPPNDALLTADELNDAIGRLLLRCAPWDGIGRPEEHLVPGAKFSPLQGNPADLEAFTSEVARKNEYIARAFTDRGPQVSAPKPLPVSAVESPPTRAAEIPSGPPVVPMPLEAAEDGRTFTLAEATARMARPRVDLSKL